MVNRKYLWFVASSLIALMTSCEMLESHPYDTDISGDTGLTEKNIALIEESLGGKTSLRFAMVSDTQRWYDETEDAVSAINDRGDIDFVIHGGDQSDFGLTDEFTYMRDIMDGLDIPWVAILGNHDCLGTGKETYATVYGETNFAFTAAGVRFVCLNTNALEYDYPDDIPDFEFLEQQKEIMEEQGINKSVVAMHARPGADVFNDDKSEEFEQVITSFPSLQFCIYGHNHKLTVDDLFGDGTIYYQCPNIKQRIYLVFTINEEGYEYEAVEY